jgi:hypothetical protein
MDKINAITILKGLQIQLFAPGGLILGLSLGSILGIEDYDDRMEFAACVATPALVMGVVLWIRFSIKEAWRLFREEEAEWDRMLNAGPRKWDDTLR